MLARLLTIASVMLMLICAGCTEPEPEYEASIVNFDERLLGTWSFELPRGTAKVTVSERTRSVAGGRVKAEGLDVSDIGEPHSYRKAYEILFEAGVSMGQKSEEGTPLLEHIRIELKGIAIAIDGVTLLAVQPSAQQIGIAYLNELVLPIHRLARYTIENDTLTIQATEKQLAWLPDVEWLDAPQSVPDEPVVPEVEGNTMVVTNDIDRLVQVLRANMNQEGFWQEESLVLTRAR